MFLGWPTYNRNGRILTLSASLTNLQHSPSRGATVAKKRPVFGSSQSDPCFCTRPLPPICAGAIWKIFSKSIKNNPNFSRKMNFELWQYANYYNHHIFLNPFFHYILYLVACDWTPFNTFLIGLGEDISSPRITSKGKSDIPRFKTGINRDTNTIHISRYTGNNSYRYANWDNIPIHNINILLNSKAERWEKRGQMCERKQWNCQTKRRLFFIKHISKHPHSLYTDHAENM